MLVNILMVLFAFLKKCHLISEEIQILLYILIITPLLGDKVLITYVNTLFSGQWLIGFSMCLESLSEIVTPHSKLTVLKVLWDHQVPCSYYLNLYWKADCATVPYFLLLYSWPAFIPMYVLSLLQVVSQEIALKL